MKRTESPLVVIGGPTASGKSALALEIAQKYNGEIICADSRTVYRGMDIGTAKPTLEDRQLVKYHLIDLVDPNEPFSAAQFQELAFAAITDITERGKLPILVGGTGLYIDAIIFNYVFGKRANTKERHALQALTVAELQQLCAEKNIPLPENANNKRHLVRVLELGGQIVQPKKLRPQTIVVAITTNKAELRSRIIHRSREMLKAGVLDEVKRLGEQYGWDAEALTGNIYRTLRPVVQGKEELESALQKIVQSDLQLAKRQITWLKRNPYIIWGETPDLKVVIEHFLQQIKLSESISNEGFSATIAPR